MQILDAMRRPLAAGLVFAALAGVLVLLFERSGTAGRDGSGEIVTTLRQLKEIDARWSVDVLRSATAAPAKDDQAAQAQTLVATLQASVNAGASTLGGIDVAPMVTELAATMERKVALIERAQAQNATLRDTLRELQRTRNELAGSARARIADRRTAAEVQQAAEALLADATTYLLQPDASLRARLEDRAAALTAFGSELPPEIADRAEAVRPLVDTLLRELKPGDDQLARIAALPTTKKIEALIDAANAERERALAAQHTWMLAVFGYAAFLLVLLGALAWMSGRREDVLDERTDALKRARRELHGARTALVQTERTSMLGQMVAGVADEIDASLTGIRAAFEGLRDPEAPTVVDDGLAGTARIGEIVNNLKTFSRLDPDRAEAFDVRDGLESTLLLLRNRLKHRIRVIREFGAVPKIICSPSRVKQVLLNLISHAVQSIPPERAGFLTLRTEMDDEKTVRIEIQDNGSGLAPEALAALFEPDFSAADASKGLGLPISYKIVKHHGGAILVDTEEHVGTVFTLLLPVEPPALAARETRVGEAA